MADSFTPTLNLTKPEINQSINTWGNKLNGDLDLIDQHALETQAMLEDHADRIAALEAVAVPAGLIAIWSGAEDAVPAGWALCDGSNGTPNLRDKFVLGAGTTNAVGSSGGANSQTVTSTAAGAHSHGGATGGTAITEAQMPSHQHGGATDAQGGHDHALPLQTTTFGFAGNPANMLQASGLNGSLRTEGAGVHQHNIATDFRGGNQAHIHSIAAESNHAHSVTVPTLPIYYTLAYIMKVVA